MKRLMIACAMLALGVAGATAVAQQDEAPESTMAGMDHTDDEADADQSPATAALIAANERMHSDMTIAYTGDIDVDFARSMIPHHQGAIDMAMVVLEYGTDPEIRALAEGIVAAQEAEIAFMRAWLEAHGE